MRATPRLTDTSGLCRYVSGWSWNSNVEPLNNTKQIINNDQSCSRTFKIPTVSPPFMLEGPNIFAIHLTTRHPWDVDVDVDDEITSGSEQKLPCGCTNSIFPYNSLYSCFSTKMLQALLSPSPPWNPRHAWGSSKIRWKCVDKVSTSAAKSVPLSASGAVCEGELLGLLGLAEDCTAVVLPGLPGRAERPLRAASRRWREGSVSESSLVACSQWLRMMQIVQ